ncbi:MAG: replication-associated recombination protein A [Candidatus Cloacimonetes bacterium]|nr:replication-associated recombination protein A [Candidatus Cloacimonadota bacterium]
MRQKSLFESKSTPSKPLAEKLKPQSLDDFLGQQHLFDSNSIFLDLFHKKRLPSLLFWGPPGCGKTSLARIIVRDLKMDSIEVSATTCGAKTLKELGEKASLQFQNFAKKTLLFVDEIHRFNKSQQDVLLPYVESGAFLLIGATTENPSFEINGALLSRVHVLEFTKHNHHFLKQIFERGRKSNDIYITFEDSALNALINLCDGDARFFLNQIELLQSSDLFVKKDISIKDLESHLPKKLFLHDKDKDQHYDLISAFHKSLRGSDVQASLYYLERMIQGGEDRKFILRRMIRFASEDIGLADPSALQQTISALHAFQTIGSPEGDLCIYQAVAYLANAPKSNSIYMAEKNLKSIVKETGQLSIPKHLRNPVTKLMKQMDYGKGYIYDHNAPYHYSGQSFLPSELKDSSFYKPGDLGFEKEIQKRQDFFKKRKQNKNG